MKPRNRSIAGKPLRRVMRLVVLPAVLVCAIATIKAQTTAPVESGPSAPDTEKAEPPPAPAQSQAEPKPDGFTVGGFVFKPGGRVKLDIIRDFSAITSEDSFDPRTIAVDGSDSSNSQLHARESRLFIDIRGPVEGKELKMYVESDFYGSSSVLRLRHAYGTWGGLLAGQTWSTFVDDANFPNTIDFEQPMAFPSIRQAQLRWTQKVTDTSSWSVAVEDNRSSITPPPIPGKAEYPMPDLVARFRDDGARLHSFVAGFLGKARFRPTDGDLDNETLWGGMLSEKLRIGKKDSLYGQFTMGDGVGRYRGAVTAVPDANDQLHAPRLYAGMAGYEHYWDPVLSSNVVYSVASQPAKDFYPDSGNSQLNYGALNLLYWFLPDRAWAGVEYLYGRREVFSGDSGTAHRVQFAVRFNLP